MLCLSTMLVSLRDHASDVANVRSFLRKPPACRRRHHLLMIPSGHSLGWLGNVGRGEYPGSYCVVRPNNLVPNRFLRSAEVACTPTTDT
jgi:hypothetical protein